ncbi:MAG: hypothetical protein EZS28_015409, partial [Streblomastix strix]
GDKFLSIMLQVDRRDKPFGYRISNTLNECGFDDVILNTLKEYLKTINDIVSWLQQHPEINQNHTEPKGIQKTKQKGINAFKDLQHIKKNNELDKDDDQLDKEKENILEDPSQWIRISGQKLISNIRKSFHDAIEVAKMIKLEFVKDGKDYHYRLLCLCKDERLDNYFYHYRSAWKKLQGKAENVKYFCKLIFEGDYSRALKEFQQSFPNIETLSKQRDKESLFADEILDGVKIQPLKVGDIIKAIKKFIPLFAPIDFNRTRNLRIDPTIFVRNQDQSIIGKDIDALIGGTGKDQLRFISSSITADFGIHIDRAQSSKCGNVTIDNLSNDDITVELKDIQENKMKIRLASNSVNVGEKIDIQFYIVEQPFEEPSIASIIFKIVAQSRKQSNQTAICDIHAFVRRTPLCALIESSSSLMLSSATSCTLAPKKFTEQINIKHHIPSVILSQKAIKWSLTSDDTNVADEPKILLDNEKLQMMMQFESSTTGHCVGQMTVEFGRTNLYKLLLNVPVQTSISTIQNIKNDQIMHSDVQGREINRVGVICGQFTEAENVERLLEKIKSLKLPEFPPPTKIQENINTNLIKDLLGQVQLKVEELINKLKIIKNPSELNQLIIQIPSLSSQIIIAVQFAGDQNISKLISNLCVLTIIVQELQKSKENMQLFQEQIQKAVETCNQIWAQLNKAGITPPAELNLSKEILEKYNSNSHIRNVQIASIPECQLQPGDWKTQGSGGK